MSLASVMGHHWFASGVGPLSLWAGCGLVAALLAASWALWLLGGAERVAPHWFYVPIIPPAARFGVPGGLAAALTAGLLAGLAPPDVTTGQPSR